MSASLKTLFILFSCGIVSLASALDVEMRYEWSLKISDPQVGPISLLSHLVVVEPPWKQFYLLTRSEKDKRVENRPGEAVLIHTPSPGSKFHLTEYRATVTPRKDTVTIRCKGKMLENIPGIFEYSAFLIPGYLVNGASFTAIDAQGKKSNGAIPESPDKLELARLFRTLILRTEYGTLRIQVRKGTLLTLADRRKNTFLNYSGLWVGAQNVDLKTPFDSEVDFSFVPNPAKRLPPIAGAVSESGDPALQNCKIAPISQKTPVDTFCIRPKYLKKGALAPKTSARGITFDPALSAEDRRKLGGALKKLSGLPAPVELCLVKQAKGYFARPEAFVIERKAEKIVLSAMTPRALRYAISALRDTDLSREFKMADYPDIPFRGIHLIVDAGTPEFGRFLVDEVWTRARYNHAVLECQWAHWDASKGAWREDTISKEKLREFVEYCRENYIEPIPCVRLLSHVGWLFKGKVNEDLKENPKHDFNYNISHPRTKQVVEALLDEVIDVFKPQYLHIGHDEVDGAGAYEFPYQPEHKKIGMAEVVYRSIMHLYGYLKAKNIRTMLWHDSFMSPHETPFGHGMKLDNPAEFRKRLPKDLVIMLWDYSPVGSKSAYRKLQSEGFQDVIGCPWYETDNIDVTLRNAYVCRIAGICGTTWWLWCAVWTAPDKYFNELEPHLRVGACAWNLAQIGKLPASVYGDIISCLLYKMRHLYQSGFRPVEDTVAEGFAVDLTKFANFQLKKQDPLLKLTEAPSIRNGLIQVGKAEFNIPRYQGKPAAVLLRSYPDAGMFPAKITIPLNRECKKIYLLGALAGETPKYDTAGLKVVFGYGDGSEREVKLHYNEEIGHIRGYSSAQLTAFDRIGIGGGYFWNSEIVNPCPGKIVKTVRLASVGIPYLILGVSGE
ncbi:MAG: family 20 glycosylhydrolase [Lentisphaeria bacterium]|nr:family 20 glycosylhydrolase [Lentisphaeria bacterium]